MACGAGAPAAAAWSGLPGAAAIARLQAVRGVTPPVLHLACAAAALLGDVVVVAVGQRHVGRFLQLLLVLLLLLQVDLHLGRRQRDLQGWKAKEGGG